MVVVSCQEEKGDARTRRGKERDGVTDIKRIDSDYLVEELRREGGAKKMDAGTLILFFVLIGFLIWFSYHLDKNRIRRKAEELGYQDIKISWAPFAPGALFEKNERHFLVSFLGSDGRYHTRYCKTSMFTGVYWRDEGDE